NFSTFLLDRTSGMLFLGARDAILAVDTKKLNEKNPLKVGGDCRNYIRLLEFLGDGRIYVCGTYAFDPQCAFLVSFPGQNEIFKQEFLNGLLYTAATSNFLGTLFDISRRHSAGNPTGDDDKIYFFFNEVAKEYDFYTKVKVPRVARVCKSDVGGMKTLQRRWTTFLKAQLVCEDKPSGQRYNVLTDVFTMQHIPGDPSSTHFYGLFTSQWEQVDLSAVCVFSLSDISKVLDGPFKELKKSCDNWINHEPIPSPRPGQCLNSALKAEGFESSLKLPDKVLTFVRDHPLMENSVTAASLLVRKGISYTKLAVNLKDGSEERRAAVLYLGTDRGELHQVAVVGQNVTLLQETPLFTSQEPVNNILLHKVERTCTYTYYKHSRASFHFSAILQLFSVFPGPRSGGLRSVSTGLCVEHKGGSLQANNRRVSTTGISQ
uniref:Sema domain-containing protein n=1 Tax=Neolamprologus brichardi TaxID=32507 RepID=A0A3Q4GTG9_NEOBR